MGAGVKTSGVPSPPPPGSTRTIDLLLATSINGWSIASNPTGSTLIQRGGAAPITGFGFPNFFNANPCVHADGHVVAHGKTAAAGNSRDQVAFTATAQATSVLKSAGAVAVAEQEGVWIYRMLVGVPAGGFTDPGTVGDVGVLVIPQRVSAGFAVPGGPWAGTTAASYSSGVGILQALGKWQWVVRQNFNNTNLPPDLIVSLDSVMSVLHPNGTVRLWEFRFFPSTPIAPGFMQFFVNGTLVATAPFGTGSIGGLATPIGAGNVNANNQESDGSAVIPTAASYTGGTIAAELFLGSYEFITGPNLQSTF